MIICLRHLCLDTTIPGFPKLFCLCFSSLAVLLYNFTVFFYFSFLTHTSSSNLHVICSVGTTRKIREKKINGKLGIIFRQSQNRSILNILHLLAAEMLIEVTTTTAPNWQQQTQKKTRLLSLCILGWLFSIITSSRCAPG